MSGYRNIISKLKIQKIIINKESKASRKVDLKDSMPATGRKCNTVEQGNEYFFFRLFYNQRLVFRFYWNRLFESFESTFIITRLPISTAFRRYIHVITVLPFDLFANSSLSSYLFYCSQPSPLCFPTNCSSLYQLSAR